MKFPSQADPRRLHVLGIIIQNLVHSRDLEYINILEIGTYVGESALYMANNINNLKIDGIIHCVDPWIPYFSDKDKNKSEHYKLMEESLLLGKAFEEFKNRMNDFNAKSKNVTISYTRGTLPTCAAEIPLKYADLVYIDGSHYYSSIAKDIIFARKICKDGGFICGDDLEKQYYEVNTKECLAHAHDTDFLGSYHPGVTLAVWNAFGYVWSQNGFWIIKKPYAI